MSRRRLSPTRSRSGFTLIELMVAMVISLIMVYAMVSVFQVIATMTADGRAIIDLNNQLRSAKLLLQNDLAGATASGKVWKGVDSAQGYFYIDEGQVTGRRDRRPGGATSAVLFGNDVLPVHRRFGKTGLGSATVGPGSTAAADVDEWRLYIDETSTIQDDGSGGRGDWDARVLAAAIAAPATNRHHIELINPTTAGLTEADFVASAHYRHAFGDVNDILMFTARSVGSPFRGRFNGRTIESNLAEIIWWTQLRENATSANGYWDPGETFELRRRVLLIRPDLNTAQVNPGDTGSPGVIPARGVETVSGATYPIPYGAEPGASAVADPMLAKLEFLRDNDISVHVECRRASGAAAGTWEKLPSIRPLSSAAESDGYDYFVTANTLSELSLRHNRTMHDPYPMTFDDSLGTNSPYVLSPLMFHYIEYTDQARPLPNFPAMPQTGFVVQFAGLPPTHPNGADPGLAGEDVVINEVTAFDVRVFDPFAPVLQLTEGQITNPGSAALPNDPLVTLQPGDEGYAKALADTVDTSPNDDLLPAGTTFGAYVDLGWGATLTHPAASFLWSRYPKGASAPQSPLYRLEGLVASTLATGSSLIPPGGLYDPPPEFAPHFARSYELGPGPFPAGATAQAMRATTWQGLIGCPRYGRATNAAGRNAAYPMRSLNPRGLTSGGLAFPNGSLMATCAFDTWSQWYEGNYLNEDNDAPGVVDPMRGPFGAVAAGRADNRDTSLLYDHSLRGIQVRIRMYDPDTRQVSQTTVVSNLATEPEEVERKRWVFP